MAKKKIDPSKIVHISLMARKNEPGSANEYDSVVGLNGKEDAPSGFGDTLMQAFSFGCMDMIEAWVEKTCTTPAEKREAYLSWYALFDTRAAYIRLKATEIEGWADFADSQELRSTLRDIREHLLGSRY